MSKHFDYLRADADAAFLQKVATDQCADLEPARAHTKLASPAKSRLELDIQILAEAGDCGMGLGMTKRACSYLEKKAQAPDLEAQAFADLFEKVATAAIERDVAGIERYLVAKAQAYGVDAEMAKAAAAAIGFELVRGAIDEKDAFLKEAGILGGIGKLLGMGRRAGEAISMAGKASIGAMKGGAKHIGGAVSSKASNMLKGYRAGRVAKAEGSLVRSSKALENAEKAVAGSKPGLMRSMREGGLESMKKVHGKRTDELLKRKNILENHGKKPALADAAEGVPHAVPPAATTGNGTVKAQALGGATTKAPALRAGPNDKTVSVRSKAGPDDKTVSVPSGPKVTVDAEKKIDAKVDTSEPKKPKIDVEDATKSDGAGSAAGTAGAAGDVADATVGGSFSKFQKSGWKSLSDGEKRKLITAGLVTAAGYRVATGRDPISGN